ncbi:uncharacterized protein METZ01_LOCUS307764, partial [marine metagenome]
RRYGSSCKNWRCEIKKVRLFKV